MPGEENTEGAPVALDPYAEIARLEQVVNDRTEQIRDLQHDLSLLREFGSALAAAIGEKAKWEVEGLRIATKWRGRNQQLAQELQLAQVGLTSGCGCPIGECQQRGAEAGSCWMLWAEAHVLQRMAHTQIGDLQRHGVHPTRFRKVREETGKTAQRLASPDPGPTSGTD